MGRIMKANKMLILGGGFSFIISILHLAIIIGGSAWYRFFGAGEEMALMAEQGSWIPGVVTFGIATVLFIWGLYAFSGARVLRPIPFLKPVLVIVSVIYLVRGLGLIPAFVIIPEQIDGLLVWSSLASLLLGMAYGIGTKQEWPNLSVKTHNKTN